MSAESAPEGEASSSTDATDKESSVECLTCGRDSFANRRGMKVHHSKVHGKSLANTIKCDWCGSSFERSPAVVEQNDHNFCGDNCRGKWLSETMSGEDNHNWGGYETTECEFCGEEFEHKSYLDRTYCGKDCRDKYNRANGSESNFWGGGKVTIECVECGDKIETYPSRLGRKKYCSKECQKTRVTIECEWCGCDFEVAKFRESEARCCSRECWGKLRSTFPQEEQPAYKDADKDYDYGPNWYPQRRKARKRDRYSCQVCGRDERQLGKIPSCHHITKLRHYRDNLDAPEWYERGNRLDNLVLLCEQHHKEWEGIPLRPQ